MTTDTPDLPYAGTSGWSGSATSHDRADRDDHDGTTSDRQRRTLGDLATLLRTPNGRHTMGRDLGITWQELAALEGWHHGQASGVLSVLHKVGRVARLTERRNRCAVYVLPEYVNGRETSPHGGRHSYRADADALADALTDLLNAPPHKWPTDGPCPTCTAENAAATALNTYRERTGSTKP